jgi:endo-beta-N-acetylglucosaminidase D
VLLTQAAAFDNAAEIASGSDRPLYGLLPSWRWTEEMTTRVEAAQQRLAERDEGLERG